MRILFFFLFFLAADSTRAEDYGPLDDEGTFQDIISEEYEAGPFLIYDCKDKHWVCVQPSYYENCKTLRKNDLAQREGLYHTCAPVGKFPTKKSCFQRQLFLTTHNHGNRFCIKDKWKEKNVKF
ncbi:MAG: hypothetical protein ACLGHN_06220 [Bacteriovoracia bacterium]